MFAELRQKALPTATNSAARSSRRQTSFRKDGHEQHWHDHQRDSYIPDPGRHQVIAIRKQYDQHHEAADDDERAEARSGARHWGTIGEGQYNLRRPRPQPDRCRSSLVKICRRPKQDDGAQLFAMLPLGQDPHGDACRPGEANELLNIAFSRA